MNFPKIQIKKKGPILIGLIYKMILYNHQTYILLFFIYSFAGWFMESVGGILNVKKFVNRGFLIGPYCPVYGIGVVLITILLHKYIYDLPALFALSILICGILEYLTSYCMEKLFNARWWDYSKRKFNINGRICLETLLPFGIVGSLIVSKINPIFINLFNSTSYTILNFWSYGLSILFIIDGIVSLTIMNSFKNETYKYGDNTEEVSSKVKERAEEAVEIIKDKAEDVFMQAESDIIVLSRKIKVKGLKLERKVKKYTSKKLDRALKYNSSEFIEKLKYNRKLLQYKLLEEKEELNRKMKDTKETVDNIIKEHKENINIKVTNIKTSSEELSKQIKEKLMKKSILHKRLLEAFPNVKTIIGSKNNKNKNSKSDV